MAGTCQEAPLEFVMRYTTTLTTFINQLFSAVRHVFFTVRRELVKLTSLTGNNTECATLISLLGRIYVRTVEGAMCSQSTDRIVLVDF